MIGAVDEDATLVFLGNVDERVSFLGNVDDLTGAVEDGRTTLFEGSSGVAAFLAVAVFLSLPDSIVVPFFTSTFTPPANIAWRWVHISGSCWTLRSSESDLKWDLSRWVKVVNSVFNPSIPMKRSEF